jgi:hypothetical protein
MSRRTRIARRAASAAVGTTGCCEEELELILVKGAYLPDDASASAAEQLPPEALEWIRGEEAVRDGGVENRRDAGAKP